jgi:hypothetical protein
MKWSTSVASAINLCIVCDNFRCRTITQVQLRADRDRPRLYALVRREFITFPGGAAGRSPETDRRFAGATTEHDPESKAHLDLRH